MNPTDTAFDAFLSYSSKDRREVARVQRFLEGFRHGEPKRRLRVFMDGTDIRGGELTREIGAALARSRTLIVCWSGAAAESEWVRREIELFREQHGERNIALVLVGSGGGDSLPQGAATWRVHDLREGWCLGIARPRARLELQRLLALLTGLPLRTLRNWHLRRSLGAAAIAAAAAIVPATGVLSYPVADWAPLTLRTQGGEPLQVVAAEAREGRLWAASQHRTWSGDHERPSLRITEDALDPDVKARFEREPQLALRSRLVPVPLIAREIRSRLPALEGLAVSGRSPEGVRFGGEPLPGRTIVIQPLAATAEERETLEERAADLKLEPPRATAALVVVSDAQGVRAAEVPGLAPVWTRRTSREDPTPPSKGVAIVWAEDGRIWLGAAAEGGWETGGLWHSPDAGRTWRREAGFASVSSIALHGERLLVAESVFERWQGATRVVEPARIVRRALPDGAWRPAEAPPFGNRSEVEFCGELDGAPVVRVDAAVFKYRPRPLVRVIFGA